MNDIRDTATLTAEMNQLRSSIRVKEQHIKEGVRGLRNSLKLRTALFSTCKKNGTDHTYQEERNCFRGRFFKAGIFIMLEKILTAAGENAEQKIYDVLETGFDKLRSGWGKKFKREK